MEGVSKLLGHTSIRTTVASYELGQWAAGPLELACHLNLCHADAHAVSTSYSHMASVLAPVPAGECSLSGAVTSKLLERIKRTKPSLLGASELEKIISDTARAIVCGQITRMEGRAIYHAANSKLMECKSTIRAEEAQLKAEIRRRLDLP